VATSDQIAAELVGLAIRQAKRDAADEEVGPWQDPLVQRATELDLGVRVPAQIAIRATLRGPERVATATEFAALVADIAGRLGVHDFAVHDADSST
jgi:hypothetical protein